MICLECKRRMGCTQTRQVAGGTERILLCKRCGYRVRTREVICERLKKSPTYGRCTENALDNRIPGAVD